jgi:hypothetical protein
MSGRPQGLRLTTTPGNFALARTPPGNRSWMCHWTHVENCIMTGERGPRFTARAPQTSGARRDIRLAVQAT